MRDNRPIHLKPCSSCTFMATSTKVRSSRRLENETYRNLEVIWLVEELRPSYKTIADFRKNNSKALTATNRDFVLLCKELHLFGCETLGIDGSFFKADASKDSIYT